MNSVYHFYIRWMFIIVSLDTHLCPTTARVSIKPVVNSENDMPPTGMRKFSHCAVSILESPIGSIDEHAYTNPSLHTNKTSFSNLSSKQAIE